MGQTQRWAPRNKQSSAAACISIVAGMDTRNRLARRPEQTYRKRNPRGEAGLAGCCAATAHRAMEDDGHGGGVGRNFCLLKTFSKKRRPSEILSGEFTCGEKHLLQHTFIPGSKHFNLSQSHFTKFGITSTQSWTQFPLM